MTLESDLSSVDPVEAKAEGLAREAGFDEDTSSQIAMVVREAVINAILHGNKKDPAKKVRVSYELSADQVRAAFFKLIRPEDFVQVVRGPAPQ